MATLEKYYQSVDKDLTASKADVASRIALGKKDIEKQAAESISGLETDIKTTRSTFGTSEAGIQKQLGELRELESKSKRGLSLIGYDRSKLLDFSQLKTELTEASSGIATGYQTYRAEVEKGIEQVKAIKQENIVALDKQAADIYKQLEAEAIGLKTEAAQKYVELDTGELIERNIYDRLSVEDRDYIQKNGVTAFNEYIQSGDYQFKAMQASGDIPADAIYIGYDTATGNINYQVTTESEVTNIPDKYKVDDTHYNLIEYLYDNPSGEQALLDAGFTQEDIDGTKATLADYKANYKRLDNGDWIPLNDTVGDDGVKYAGFNSLTPEQQAYMQANGVEAFNTWNSNKHDIAIAKAQADYAKAMQEYINNPNTQTLYNLTQMQTELARIQNEGYYTFKTMQASGEIPENAQYTGYDTETGNVLYLAPETVAAFALLEDYKTVEAINRPIKIGEPTTETFYDIIEYLYDNPNGEQTLLDAGFSQEDIDDTKATLADYQANYKRLDNGDWIPLEDTTGEDGTVYAGFNSLTPEQQAYMQANGVEAFNTWNEANMSANYKRLDTGEWIPLNSYTDEDGGTVLGYNDMTPEQQDYISRLGVTKFNNWMKVVNETRNEALSQLDKYKIDDTHYDLVEYFVDGGELDLLVKAGFTPEDWNESFFIASDYKNNYKRLDNGDWIPLNDTVGDDGIKYAGYNSFTPEQQEYLQKNGVEAFNTWLDSQSVSVVEITKADGTKETIEQSEWDAKSELQQYEYYLGREPTLSEWQGYRLQQLIDSGKVSETNVKVYYGLVGIGAGIGVIGQMIGGEELKAEAILNSNTAAQTEWQREYPEQMWSGAFINSLEDLGFPAAKAFYNQITVKDISGSEWAMTGLSAALWTTPAWLPKVVKGIKGTVKTVKAIKTTVAKTIAKPITKITTNISNRANILQSDILTGSYNVASKAATALKSTAIAKVATKAISKIPKISSVANIRATNLTSATRGITSTTVEKFNEAIVKLGANITSGTKATVLKSADELIDIANKLKTSDVNLILKGKGITVTQANSITKLANSLKREAGYIKALKDDILESRQLPKLQHTYDDVIKLVEEKRYTDPIMLDIGTKVLEVTPKAEAIAQLEYLLKTKPVKIQGVRSSYFTDTILEKGWGKYTAEEYAKKLYDAIGKVVHTSGYAQAIEIYGEAFVKAYSPKALNYAAAELLFRQNQAIASIARRAKEKRFFESIVDTTKPVKETAAQKAEKLSIDLKNEELLDDIWEQVENYATEQRSKGFTVTRDDMYLMVKDAYEKVRIPIEVDISSNPFLWENIPEQNVIRLTLEEQMRFLQAPLELSLDEIRYFGKSLKLPKASGISKPISTTGTRIGQPTLDKPFTGVGIPSIPINVNALANANVSIVNQQVLNTITPAQLSGIEQLTARQVEAIATTYGLTTEQVRIAQKEGTLKTTIQNVVNTQTQSVTQTQGVILTNANIDALSTINMDNTIKASIEAPYEVTETITQPIEVPAPKPITQDETITQPIEVPAPKPITQDETIPKHITQRITNVKVTEIKTGKTRILKVINMDDEEKEEIKEGTKELPIGSVVWRQGKFWKALIPPYKTGDLLNLKQQPMNYSKYSTGEGSAYRTVGVVGGVMPEQIDIDYGVMDIKIARDLNNDVYMDFDNKGLDTDIGKSKKSKTKGITVRDKRVSNIGSHPDLPDRYYLNHKLPDAGIIVNI